jgi:hypothetical protein
MKRLTPDADFLRPGRQLTLAPGREKRAGVLLDILEQIKNLTINATK